MTSQIQYSAINSGIKKNNKLDLSLIKLPLNSKCVGAWTLNKFCAAPVVVAKEHIKKQNPKFLLINSGNANAGTGIQGIKDAIDSCEKLAKITGCKTTEILPFSTGVIGQKLPIQKMTKALPDLIQKLDQSNLKDVAEAILTTDTTTKIIQNTIEYNNKKIKIWGFCKGSGMIEPNMATMLAYVFIDADIQHNDLQILLKNAVNLSFNKITVDGDTSTNDACILVCTGNKENTINTDDLENKEFLSQFNNSFIELAKKIIYDGEGATKFITINVKNAKTTQDADIVARSVAKSSLVKTAFFASDANWGRILSAVGNAKIDNLEIDKTNIFLDNQELIINGELSPNYTEKKGEKIMQQKAITINIDLQNGTKTCTIFSCDLSYDYIKINAEYRT
ncbi:MAG: bifunctional ornithine acetyltransferase/N-acetylglutamate synthase [Gammaproteobacteria bacterium]|nr:MAG: bifunctional ornithine acetyltransferase/N-acetylglutamate synthase [Gammaproteobacteria bacterium]